MRYLLLVAFALLLASGQVLFKLAAMAGKAQSFPLALCNGWLAAALLVYALATVLWVWILRTTLLSLAYPFVALGFVLVPLAAHYLFGEPIAARQVLGTLLIIAGLIVIGA